MKSSATHAQIPLKGQPELKLPEEINKIPTGESRTVRFQSVHVTPSVPSGIPDVGQSSIAQTRVSHDPEPRQDFWMRSGHETLIRVHVEPRCGLFVPTSADCPVDVASLSSQRCSKVQPVQTSVGFASSSVQIDDDWIKCQNQSVPFLWTGTNVFCVQVVPSSNNMMSETAAAAYPTEDAIRQKKKKAEGHKSKPRIKHVEQHQDDCGQDLSSLSFATAKVKLRRHPMHSIDDQENEIDDETVRMSDTVHSMFQNERSYGFGSSTESLPSFWLQYGIMSMEQAYVYRSKFEQDGIDCMVMFGGKGTTTYILSKHHNLKTGVNFELTVGIDLLKEDDVRYLFAYIERNKPKVILMAPVCKGYSKWGHLNRRMNHDAWLASRRISVPLAKLSGKVAKVQVDSGRHFLVEQPQGSGLFQEKEWTELSDLCYSVTFDQCMVGLKMQQHPWWPVKKPTECRASHPSLIAFLQNLRCSGNHPHAHIGKWSDDDRPTARSSEMQVWPLEPCRRIAAGVVECIMSMSNSVKTYAARKKPDKDDKKDPKRKVTASNNSADDHDKAAVCPACKGHMRKTDDRHTRGPESNFVM